MFYIFEIANNHNGSVSHAKKIINAVSKIVDHHKVVAGIKLQFRQLDTFIASKFQKSDKKFIKRFQSTALNKDEFSEIIDHIRSKNLKVIATPFDNESLQWIEDFDVDVVKVASCSIDDWILLDEISNIKRKIIISTAGADEEVLHNVYDIFHSKARDFAFMHCVGEYPTQYNHANLDRISWLQRLFPNLEIGYSTHESPLFRSLCPYAVAMGCSIVEKHVGLPIRNYPLNDYSVSPYQLSVFLDQMQYFEATLYGTSNQQDKTLRELKRYLYVKNQINVGEQINISNLSCAIPMEDERHLCVSELPNVVNLFAIRNLLPNTPLMDKDCTLEFLLDIKTDLTSLLERASVTTTLDDKIELSAHYGINNFSKTGCCIIEKVNRSYCKKIIVVLPGQFHPTHHHIRKEETFELLYGDCCLVINKQEHKLKLGRTITINPKDKHSFASKNGCVFEEISTTHYLNDSIYEDPAINKLPITSRKISIRL